MRLQVESNDAKAASDATSSNPTFELVYWRFGLSLAARWRARLGLTPVAAWEAVLARLCTPTARPLGGGAAARATGEGAQGAEGAGGGATAGAEVDVYYPYEGGPCPLISNGVAPQVVRPLSCSLQHVTLSMFEPAALRLQPAALASSLQPCSTRSSRRRSLRASASAPMLRHCAARWRPPSPRCSTTYLGAPMRPCA